MRTPIKASHVYAPVRSYGSKAKALALDKSMTSSKLVHMAVQLMLTTQPFEKVKRAKTNTEISMNFQI